MSSQNPKDVGARKADESRARTREQLASLIAIHICAQHRVPERECPDCARKLTPMSAALVLSVLPPTPTDKLLASVRELQSMQPMTWSAILRANTVLLAQTLRRIGKQAFTPAEYQSMASDMAALLRASAA